MTRACLRAAALCVLLATTSANAIPELDEDRPDVVFSPAIVAKAAALGNEPVRIYEFVRNDLGYQPYYGLMKGPDATLRSGAGNEYDLAALLVSLLRASGTPARFVRGRIHVTTDQAKRWTGASSQTGANILFRNSQPQGWSTLIRSVTTGGGIDRLHLWVEAEVPLARYRGAGGDPRGRAWVPLDPSYKLRKWNADPGFISGASPEIGMNYTGEGGYYRSINPKLPVEIFEDQYRAHLAANHPTVSLEQTTFGGPVEVERAGVIPTSLPYTVLDAISQVPVRRSPSLERLHGADTPNPEAGSTGAPEYRYSWSVYVCTAAAAECVSNPGATRLIAWEGQWTASLDGHRVTLTFPPAGAPPQDPKGYTTCDGTLTRPTIRVDGEVKAEAPAGVPNVAVCDGVVFHIVTTSPLGFGPPTVGADASQAYRRDAGGTYLLLMDANGAGAEATRAAAEGLTQAEAVARLAEDASGTPFLDSNGDGTKGPSEAYLGADFAAQDALIGGLLHLAGSRYVELVRAGEHRVYALFHRFYVPYPATGLVASGLTSARVLGTPFHVRPSRLLLDVRGLLQGSIDRSGVPDPSGSPVGDLVGNHYSAAEHTVWEEIAAAEAISTVKGFQVQHSQGQELLVVACAVGDSASCESQARQIRQQAGCSASTGTCGTIDPATYCELYRAWPQSDAYRAWTWEVSYPNCSSSYGSQGITVYELRISKNARFQYHDPPEGWDGYVFFQRSMKNNTRSTSYTIAPCEGQSCGGGYALRTAYSAPWISPSTTNLFYAYDDRTFGKGLTNSWATMPVTAGDPVSVVTGNNQHLETDFEIAGRGGLDLRMVRSYNSRLAYDGPLGHGWTHTYDQHLRRHDGDTPQDPSDDRIIWLGERGEEIPFDDPTGLAGVLAPDKGIHHRLVRESDGSLTLTLKEGAVYRFLAPDTAGKARLSSIEDRNGNTITCRYDVSGMLVAVADTAGRELTFVNTNGRLARIEDWTRTAAGAPDRVWTYTVDAAGDLVAYLDPEQKVAANGRPTVYRYSAGHQEAALNHNLLEIILPADRDSSGSGDVSMRF
ncbi:MAG: hypothetical protein IT386_02025, partial [Deltaproteobacteria bacterium]|nr:hypothetical protein [Deltaproteobacteria bacterium]